MSVNAVSTSRIIVTPQTIRNILHDTNIWGRASRKKKNINETNRVKRLEFAKAYVSKTLEFWRKLFFSDENKFNIFGSDAKKIVWRTPHTSLQIQNLKTALKHDGGHVIIWGCIYFNEVGGEMALVIIGRIECHATY